MSMNSLTERELVIAMDVGAEVDARKSALEKLEAIGDAEAVPPLAVLLTEIEHDLVPLVKRTLRKLGATDLLAKRVAARSEEERAYAVRLLGYLEDDEALPVLLQALEDREPRVRTLAADALIRLHPASVIGPLEQRLLTDPDPEVRMASAQALGEIATQAAVDALERSMKVETDGFVLVIVELSHDRAERIIGDRAFWS
jgi:HEAT repeat protein